MVFQCFPGRTHLLLRLVKIVTKMGHFQQGASVTGNGPKSANSYKSVVFVGPFFRQKWQFLVRSHEYAKILRISG